MNPVKKIQGYEILGIGCRSRPVLVYEWPGVIDAIGHNGFMGLLKFGADCIEEVNMMAPIF